MLDFNRYELITFDCYGTLIDWESGILSALNKLFSTYNIKEADEDILKLYANFESKIEEEQYHPYREVLGEVVIKFSKHYMFDPTKTEINSLAYSLSNWLQFPDSISSLKILKEKYQLGIISNIDNDLFAASNKLLDIEFDYIVTAEDVGAYKPSESMFRAALKKTGIPKEKILHVAQSIYHDHIPAKQLGFDTVWINRRSSLPGTGATPPAIGAPDLEFPDLTSFVNAINAVSV